MAFAVLVVGEVAAGVVGRIRERGRRTTSRTRSTSLFVSVSIHAIARFLCSNWRENMTIRDIGIQGIDVTKKKEKKKDVIILCDN